MDKKNIDPLQDLKDDIHNLIGGRQFGSMEELQTVLNDFNRQKNTTPNEDFHGLSSEQMHRFLHFPFESPDLVRYPGVEEKFYEKPKETLRRVYILRSLERFADFFGLVELKSVSDTPYKPEYQVRATGHLGAVLQFEIGSPGQA